MVEGLVPYPRFEGKLFTSPRAWVIIEETVRDALRSTWTLTALLLSLGLGVSSIIEFQSLRQSGASSVHDGSGFLALLSQLPWFALAVAATIGGPALINDVRSGAIELYFSRSVSRVEYLTAKAATVFALTTLSILAPAAAYWASSFVFYSGHPPWWNSAMLGALGIALLWGAVASGVALGISAVSRSTSAPALILLGLFSALDYLVDPPALAQRISTLTALTGDPRANAISPLQWLKAQQPAMLGLGTQPAFPAWWGLVGLGLLAIIGWGLVYWRGPRPRGDDVAG